jgi:hypothetical protein
MAYEPWNTSWPHNPIRSVERAAVKAVGDGYQVEFKDSSGRTHNVLRVSESAVLNLMDTAQSVVGDKPGER